MSNERLKVNINRLTARDVLNIQQAGMPELGSQIHRAVAVLAILDAQIEMGNEQAQARRTAESMLELPVEKYNLLAAIVGWELITASESEDLELDENYQPFPEQEEIYPFPEEA